MGEIQVMDENFTPKKRGRPALISVKDFIGTAQANPGLWCAQVFDVRSAVSAARQLKKAGLEVSTAKHLPEGRTVFFRVVQ